MRCWCWDGSSSPDRSLRCLHAIARGGRLIWLACIACHGACAAPVSVRDDTGRSVTLEEPATRIVSLSPHATELLFAAGAGARVVGAASFSDYPQAARHLPGVGDSGNLDLERIFALQPDLVVAWESGNTRAQVEQLSELGMTVFYSEPRRLETIATNLERLGQLAGSAQTADEAAAAFRAAWHRLEREYADRAPVRTFYQIWHQPLITINGEQLISQVIGLCGGINIFAGLDTLAPVISREAVVAADPEIIIASGKARERPQWLAYWQAWPQLSAVKNRQLYVIDPDLIQRQTPRILEGAEIMCRQLQQAREAMAE